MLGKVLKGQSLRRVSGRHTEELGGGIPQPQDLNLSKLRGEAQSRVSLKGQKQISAMLVLKGCLSIVSGSQNCREGISQILDLINFKLRGVDSRVSLKRQSH